MPDKPDLLTRAQAAAQEVVRLKNEITTLKVLMRKAKAEAASLRKQVIEAMGPPKTRTRKPKKSGTSTPYADALAKMREAQDKNLCNCPLRGDHFKAPEQHAPDCPEFIRIFGTPEHPKEKNTDAPE